MRSPYALRMTIHRPVGGTAVVFLAGTKIARLALVTEKLAPADSALIVSVPVVNTNADEAPSFSTVTIGDPSAGGRINAATPALAHVATIFCPAINCTAAALVPPVPVSGAELSPASCTATAHGRPPAIRRAGVVMPPVPLPPRVASHGRWWAAAHRHEP